MDNVINKQTDKWIKPWNLKKFDELAIRDERYFSLLIKGCLNWLNRNIVMYDKPIKHFIFNTGSSYLYVESNGYEFSWSETSGEDQMYMEMPRCVCEIGDINIPTEELSNPFVRGIYERKSSITNEYKGYNAEMRRLPIELTMNLRYVLSNFNESIVLLQELIENTVFQQYYIINYLGQKIQCSIEFPINNQIQLNQIDFDSTEVNQKVIEVSIKIDSYLPIINIRTEMDNIYTINASDYEINIYSSSTQKVPSDQSDKTYDVDSFDYGNKQTEEEIQTIVDNQNKHYDNDSFIQQNDEEIIIKNTTDVEHKKI